MKKAAAGDANPVNVTFDSNVLKMASLNAHPNKNIVDGIKYIQLSLGAK